MSDTMTEQEAQTHEYSQRVLSLVEERQPDELATFLDKLDGTETRWVLLALAAALLGQEAANESLAGSMAKLVSQNRMLDNANVQLFADKRKLMDRVKELRAEDDAAALASTANQKRRGRG